MTAGRGLWKRDEEGKRDDCNIFSQGIGWPKVFCYNKQGPMSTKAFQRNKTLVILCFLSISLCFWLSPFLCSCLLPKETKSGGEGKLMKTGICGNGEGDREVAGMMRWGPSGDECNRSRMIMAIERWLSTLCLSTVVVSQGKICRARMYCNV